MNCEIILSSGLIILQMKASGLISGNVSHLGANVRGIALRSAKFIEEFSVGIGDIAKDYK